LRASCVRCRYRGLIIISLVSTKSGAVQALPSVIGRQWLAWCLAQPGAFPKVLTTTEELGMRPLQARCHLGLGKLCRRIDRTDEARAELATAVAMLREMGMAFWLPEAERELGETT